MLFLRTRRPVGSNLWVMHSSQGGKSVVRETHPTSTGPDWRNSPARTSFVFQGRGQVGRTDRMFRFPEEVRSKWRRRRTLVRFVVLTRDPVWRERTTTPWKATDRPKPTAPGQTEGGKSNR